MADECKINCSNIWNKWHCVFCDVEMNSIHDTHNPEPVKESGRCCSHCNTTVVIPARLRQIFIELHEMSQEEADAAVNNIVEMAAAMPEPKPVARAPTPPGSPLR